MGRNIKIELSDNQRKELENGCRKGKSHAFRTRCQMVLLKSEEHKVQSIADFLGFCQQAVKFWLHRYKREGINGLSVKAGGADDARFCRRKKTFKASGKRFKNIGKEFPSPVPNWNHL
jgi:predicted ArsR family transcriptional regulator